MDFTSKVYNVFELFNNRMPPHTMFIGEIVDVIEK